MAGGINYTPGTYATNHVLTAAEFATEVTTAFANLMGSWSGTYTPALTAVTTAPTLGTGNSTVGTWYRTGKTITAEGDITAGTSGTTVGSGIYQVSLPTAAESSAPTIGKIVGSGAIFDSSAGRFYPFVLRCVDSTTTARLIDGGTGVYISDSLPAGFGGLHINDKIQYELNYQSA